MQHILSSLITTGDPKIPVQQPIARGPREPAKDGEKRCAHLRHQIRAKFDSIPSKDGKIEE